MTLTPAAPETQSPAGKPPPPPSRWPWQRSLQVRMILAFGGTFLVILALLTFWISREVYKTYIDSAEHDLEVAAFLAANALEDPLSGYANEFEQYQQWEAEHAGSEADKAAEDSSNRTPSNDDESDDDESDDNESDDDKPAPTPTPPPPAPPSVDIVLPRLQGVAELYAKDAGARVTILDNAGHAVADSHYPISAIGRQNDQPEFKAALTGNELGVIRADPATGKQTMYTAAPIQQGSNLLGIVQLSKPMEIIEENARGLLMTVLLAGMAAVLASTLLAIWISRQLVRPIERLETAALAAAAGDLSHQVPVQTSDELGALASAFNYMVGEVHTMLEQQRAFVANASHELRTPLTNIKLRIEAVRTLGDEDAAISTRYLAEIESEADRLTRLANQLLDLAHLESDGLMSPAEAVDIAPALHEMAAIMSLRAQNADIALHCDVPASLPRCRVYADEIEEAVVNLLDNAIKYTPRGGNVTLAATHDGQRVQVRIADTGPGIPPADLPHIFDRFYRVDKVRSRSKGAGSGPGSGAGLGLSIAKQLIERNDGQIRVETSPEQGTTFVLSFPAVA